MKPIVYLAGPITGLSYSQVTSWRKLAQDRLGPEIQCASPMRGFEHLRHETALEHTYVNHPFTNQRGIMMRDYFDVHRSVALLVNLLGSPKQSAGTIIELAWAWQMRKQVVVVMEPSGNPHDGHPMILEAIDYRVPDLDYGIELVRTIVSTS